MIKQLVNISTTLLVLYNVLQAFKASKMDRRLHKRYNKYFLVIAVFLVLDNLFSFILNFIPFYQLFKLVLVTWMSIPTGTGAVFAYKFYINGILNKYEGRLDDVIEKIKGTVSGYFSEYYERAQKKYQDHRLRGRKDVDTESLGIKNSQDDVSVSKAISTEDVHMDEGSESGFSAIDSTIHVNEEKSISGLSTRWADTSVDDGEGTQKESVM